MGIGGLIGGAVGWLVVVLVYGNASWMSIAVAAALGVVTTRVLLAGHVAGGS
jgi:hypothetical protein